MTTVAKTSSDSENDSDYVPPADADEESSSSDDEQPGSKRARAESPKLSTEEEEARKKALWASFQASVNESSSSKDRTVASPSKLVKIQKRYRFAGEELTEVVEVPEDSPEAKTWPIWHPTEEPVASSTSSATTGQIAPAPLTAGGTQIASEVTPSTSAPLPTALTSSPTPSTPVTGKQRPGPRKPKVQLAELPGGSGAAKAKKLTTLDKSVMDWKAHVQESGNVVLRDELEANRRGGTGYLDKVDFLQRVDERKDAVLDAAKAGGKRRRL
ncbi:hypothetical protein AX15_005998 [Amanita polypyramis BW_CC]|nr:hypothetical protein AX15_005998 [Amanita polypyramis BW_CC]